MSRFTPSYPENFKPGAKKGAAGKLFMKKAETGNKKTEQQSPEERYQEIYKEKIKEVHAQAMQGNKYNFHLPGTDPTQCKELSKGAQEVLKKIAEKRAKKEEKRQKQADTISISAKRFTGMQGGRIDGDGNIYDSAGQCIMKVDKKTGKIKTKNGNTVGKYSGSSPYSEHRICELISKHSTAGKAGWWGGTQGHGSLGGGGGWDKGRDSAGGGMWGGSTKGFWGGNDDDKGGGNGWW